MLDSSAKCDIQDDCLDIDIRAELNTMSRDELIDEVLNRMKATQDLIVSNWEHTEQMREENKKLRQSIEYGLSAMEHLKSSAKVWKYAFFIFVLLTLVETVI